jgi:addiction module RelB/DinJ family antitoxin
MNNTTLQIRIDKRVKERARKAFAKRGLDMSSGVKLMLTQVANADAPERSRAHIRALEREAAYTKKHGKAYSVDKFIATFLSR